jgi:hypothetical protein
MAEGTFHGETAPKGSAIHYTASPEKGEGAGESREGGKNRLAQTLAVSAAFPGLPGKILSRLKTIHSDMAGMRKLTWVR